MSVSTFMWRAAVASTSCEAAAGLTSSLPAFFFEPDDTVKGGIRRERVNFA